MNDQNPLIEHMRQGQPAKDLTEELHHDSAVLCLDLYQTCKADLADFPG